MNSEKYFNANKDLWNKRVAIHKKSELYEVEGFKKGKSSLQHIELEELGEVKGKSMLHLQCHFGLDTLSWVRLGAKVTGVDFSEEAIDLAKSL
ncbi:MAG: SAM-dependent methyltransferase, partial [Ignavibacteriaceae bacterium]|nr:SAM-dependent methyltransferase [Ignavibacteriaceae bacterium]